jgi:hypothetical protein
LLLGVIDVLQKVKKKVFQLFHGSIRSLQGTGTG